MPIETADEYTQIEQEQRQAHEAMPVREPEPLYPQDTDQFEVIDSEH